MQMQIAAMGKVELDRIGRGTPALGNSHQRNCIVALQKYVDGQCQLPLDFEYCAVELLRDGSLIELTIPVFARERV